MSMRVTLLQCHGYPEGCTAGWGAGGVPCWLVCRGRGPTVQAVPPALPSNNMLRSAARLRSSTSSWTRRVPRRSPPCRRRLT